jgi:Protein of unknown function (DUF3037)
MTPYQFQVLRYVHDRVTGEFVNVGIVLLASQEGFLRARAVRRAQRVLRFFPSINAKRLLMTLRDIERTCNEYGQELKEPTQLDDAELLTHLTRRVIRPNDAAWHWTPPQYGIALDVAHTFDHLYRRHVETYTTLRAVVQPEGS